MRAPRPARIRGRRRAALVLAAMLGACGDPLSPLPAAAVAIEPPAVYARWWSMVEACSGLRRAMSDVRFHVVPGAYSVEFGGGRVSGYWRPAGNAIVLAGDLQFEGALVRHEMLHALRQDGGHRRSAFLEDCGGVVSCGTECVREAGPLGAMWPHPPVVAPSALTLGVEVEPSTVSVADGGFATVTVTVRNPSNRAVVVALPAKFGEVGRGFELTLRGPEWRAIYGDPLFDAGVTRFAAGEVKRHVFDVRAGSGRNYITATVGTYEVLGHFGEETVASPTRLVVAP